MKKYISILGLFVLCFGHVCAYSFKAPNANGDELAFNILTANTVAFTYDVEGTSNQPSYADLTCDTLWIPEMVTFEGNQYTVTMLGKYSLRFMNPNVRVAVIPQTIDSIYCEIINGNTLVYQAVAENNLKAFSVDSRNAHYASEKGMLFSKNKKRMISYPARAKNDSVFIPEGVETLSMFAIAGSDSVRYLELPLSLKRMEVGSIGALKNLNRLIIKDSIQSIDAIGLFLSELNSLTLGEGLQSVGSDFIYTDKELSLYCRATTPPTVRQSQYFIPQIISNGSRLFVPRNSLNAYRNADGWKNFGSNIFPIEPPIMATDEGVTISWVQSFSATGYVWYMYQDEEHTQLVMSLTFDQDGRLTEMAFGPAFGSGTQQAPARRADEDGEENAERFAEYYSFTIRNLSAKTNYYYTRQTLSGEEVIDTEDGTFNTDPDHVPTANGMLTLPERATKTLQDGNVVIIRNGKRYLLNGAEVK